jgi:hypothetical protein
MVPQHLPVGVAAHDNLEHEIAGWVGYVTLFNKADFNERDIPKGDDLNCFKGKPDRAVVLRC